VDREGCEACEEGRGKRTGKLVLQASVPAGVYCCRHADLTCKRRERPFTHRQNRCEHETNAKHTCPPLCAACTTVTQKKTKRKRKEEEKKKIEENIAIKRRKIGETVSHFGATLLDETWAPSQQPKRHRSSFGVVFCRHKTLALCTNHPVSYIHVDIVVHHTHCNVHDKSELLTCESSLHV